MWQRVPDFPAFVRLSNAPLFSHGLASGPPDGYPPPPQLLQLTQL